MPLDKGKLQKLYSTLQQGGYSQSYDEFEKGFTGNENYANRKKVYDLLTEHGADIGSSYEEFMGKMQPSQPSAPAPAPAPSPKPKPAPKPRAKAKSGGGMTAAQRAAFINSAQNIVNHSRANTNRTLNKIGYMAQKLKHKNVGKVHLGYGKRTGGNGNVMVKHKDGSITEDNGYSPQLNQALGNTYVTESGNEYDAPTGADFEQTAIDNQKTLVAQYNSERSVPGRLKSAYEMRDELEKKLEARRAELEKQRESRGTVANVLQDMGNIYAADKMGGVNPYSDEMRGYENDPEYMSLMSSLRKVNSSIQTLETIKTGKGNSFWQGLKDTLSNGYTFNDGLPKMRDATAVINAQKHLPSINKKLKSGKPLTHEEQVAYDVLRANVFDNDVQGQYQNQLGAWYRAGSTNGTSLDFMKDIMFTGGGATSMTKGVYNEIVKKGAEALAKRGIENGAKSVIAKGVLKATGIAAGTTAAGAMVTNTTGFGRVGAETATNVAGQVGRDKDGNFTVEGNQSLLHGFVNAERDMIGENQSEMFGEFIPGGGKYIKKGLEKIGLSKISGALTSIGNKQWYKQYSNLLKAGGWNGLPGEAIEEYEGMLFDALTGNGEQAWQQIKDPKTHIDIWLGCATTGALLGAVPTAVQIHHTAQYYRYKHATDSSDKVAAFRMTQEKWEPLKDIFDNTDNEHMADAVMDNVVNNKDLSQPEKVAALNYVRNLTKMRGYNISTANNAGEESDPNVEAQNEAYGKGYNATDATSMNDARNKLSLAQQKLDEAMKQQGVKNWQDSPDMQSFEHRHRDANSILEAKWDDGSLVYPEGDPMRKLAQDVVNAQQEYEGMMQRVRDDIDDEVQQTSAIYDSRMNDQGVIQSATLKAQNPDGTGKKVYITSGNVVMTDDGKSVDKQKSDMSIVVVDEDGKVQMISPDQIFSLDAPIDGAQAKQDAINAIQQSRAQEAADKINGKIDLTAGNTYTLTDSTGQQIEATIVADEQTGAVQNPDGTVNVSMNGKVVPVAMDTLQQMVDNTNMQRTAQGDEGNAEQPTEQEGDQGGTVEPEGGVVDLSNIGEGEGEEGGGTVVSKDESSGVVPSYPGSVVAPDVQEPHEWQVDDTFTIDNGGMPVRGQVTGIDADGVEIYTESPVNGKKMQVISPEELQSKVSEINGEAVQAQPEEAVDLSQQQTTDEQTSNNGEENIQNGGETEQNKPERAIDRIPSQQVEDGKGNVRTVHNWEQAEPGDTYDALTEIYHGNADRVKKGIDNRVGKIDKAIKGVQKKMDAIDNSDDFDEVAAQSDQYDQLQQQKDALEQQKKYWQSVSRVPQSRKMEADRRTAEEKAAAKAAQEKAEAEAAEKARQEREQVNGVPDVINDVPADARQRGFRNVNGMVVKRQDNTEGVTGRESNVKFSSTDTAKGHIKVIDADELQPSHVSGQRNPAFFIDEAQPKDRTDTVSSMAAAKIASNLNPEEITGDGSAYQFSAPTVNSRGEVIQGNNRSDALKLMYSSAAFKPAQDAYKQYIADHAEEFGFTPEDVAKIQQMEHPVMVNELDVPDDEAIRLGQMRASDNESGGIERIDPVTTSQKLGTKVSNFASVLLSSPDEDASLSDVLMQNGAKAVKWLQSQGAISDTAAQSAFDKKGNLTPEVRMDLQNILKQSLFQGGVSDLSTMFDKMPAKAQKAILSTFMRDFDSAESERILPEIQKAIEAWYGCAMANDAFAKASNYKAAKAAMHDWTLQTNLLDDNMPSDKFSNFAMELACRLQGCSMRETQQSLNDFFDLVQGKSQGDLFGGTTMGEQADRQESIRRIFNIEYKPISNNNGKTRSNAVADNGSQSREGRQGSPTDGKGRERAEGGKQPTSSARGTESHDEGTQITHVDTYGHGSRTYITEGGKTTIIFNEGHKVSYHGGEYTVGKRNDDGTYELMSAPNVEAFSNAKAEDMKADTAQHIGNTSSSEKVEAERQGVNTEPTEGQKQAGNYKKGHIKVDGYDITIENPKGSVREKKDANGKVLWRTPMHYDYGYILGTKGTDGDHIDVYLCDNPTSGNVYVVDQIDQKTGKFDEHKVMYGFPSKEAAIDAYKSQYEKGWKVGTVTEVSREDFKKWVDSSKRKTKPFSEYKSVKTVEEPQSVGTGDFGPIYDQFKGKPKEAINFLLKKKDGEAIGALHHKDIGDIDLVWGKEGTGHSDGYGLAKLAKFHPEVLDNLQDILDDMHVTKRTENRVQLESDTHQATVRLTWNDKKKTWLLTAFEKKNSALDNTTDTAKTSDIGKRNDTATPQSTVSEGKDKQSSSKKQEKGEKNNQGQFGLVSDKRMEELKKRLRDKLNNLNMGVDPEVIAIGLELTTGYIDRGIKKFADYAKVMINDLGEVVRPYLKAFYNGVREMPEITSNGLDKEMDDYDTVSKFNVATIGNEGNDVHPSILDTAEQVSNESHVEKEAQKVSDDDVEKEREKGKMEMHEVDTDKLFNDLKAGKSAKLSDYYKDKEVDAAQQRPTDSIEARPAQGTATTTDEGLVRTHERTSLQSGEKGDVKQMKAGGGVVSVSKREAALRDAVMDLEREAGLDVIDDVEEGQRVLDMVNGEAKLMGSRTNKKMANIGEALEGRELTERQQKVVDVFRGKSDNTPIEVERADGKVRVIMRQGNDEKAGTKHSLYGHYGTNKGVITDEDILIIPDVLARGERTPKMRGNTQLYEYTLNGENGTRYTVLTEKKHSREEFADFYTNKKTSQSARKTRSEEARDIDNNDVSSAKLQQNSDTFKEMSGKIREQRVYHGSAADFDAFDTMNHLSEGEGNQAFGAGTYVADQKDLGMKYANIAYDNDHNKQIAHWNGERLIKRFPTVEDFLNNPKTQEAMAKNGKTEAELRAYYDKQQKNAEAPRILYTVEIPDDNGKNYLDWDGELTREQADTIRKKLYDAVLARNDDYKGSEEYLAQDLSVIKEGGHIGDTYGTISDYLGSDKAASEFLHDLGYTGFKMHAAHNSSDKRYKNNWNYVIFNDKDLKMKGKVRFFRTADGDAYGYTVGGKIYIDPRVATSETPIHEYAHLWAEALRKVNPKEWQNVVELMKECKSVWEQVKKEYPELKTDDEIADEVLAHYSGKRGAERLRAEAAKAADGAKSDLEKDKVKSAFSRLKDAIKKAWKHIAEDILHIHFTTAEEVADKVMYDLLNKVNPNRFNLSKSVEEGKDLIAVHNLTEDKLKQSLELGGFPMPSIAITKSSMGHAEYGDISLLFGKDTINPSDSRNKVYSGDAWTPTFPHVSYKLDEKKLRDIYSRALKAGNLPFFDSARLHPENLKDRVDGNDSAKIIESGKKDYGMKQMFLSEKGNPVKGYVQKTVDKYSPERVELLQEILDKIGVEGLRNGKYEDELKQIVGSYRHVDLDSVKPFFAKLAMQNALRDAIDFAENGNKKVENDVEATQKEIDSRIAPKEYDQWLHEMLEGITEKKGIRNNTDPYTRSGDRLKWERLYDAVTLDNVLKAMKAQPAKSGGFFNSIFGASAKELSNLNEVREEAKRRIKSVPEEEFKAEKDKILSRLEKISLPSVERSNSISGAMDFVENVKDAVVHSHTPRGIYKYLSDIYPDMTIDVANEIADVVKDIQSMSTRYLEAKPYRAVGFDEVRAAVVPSDTEAKIVQQLKDKGIPVYTYEKGNAEERRQVVNDAAQEQSVKFHKAEFGNSKKAAENEVEAVNKRFNEELEKYKRGEVPIGTRFELGMPSKALESAGFPYLPISMRASLLSKKAGMERHPFEASDLRDLVKAMQMPIAIFKYSKDNMRNLIVDVKHGDKHFLVGITLDYKAGDIEVNSVSGLFPKESHEWIKWIQDGKAIRIDQKKKVLDLIDSLRTNPAESERIGLNLSSVAKIVEDFENPVIKGENLSFEGEDGSIKDVPTTPEETEESDVLYRIADDDEAAMLDKEPTVKVYRAMQLINGKLYPPMMAAVKGKLVEPRELGQWEVADERPDIIENIKKNKAGEEIGYVTLDKGSKDSTGKKGTPIKGVAYNPYWHTSRSPLNDQFKSAWIRPNIVTVEVEVPVSELRSGYRAKYAKDPVGETDWHSGSVTKQLTAQGHSPRKVILSRYDKPVRVLSAAETAERIIDYIGDHDVTIPENVVTPQVRVELEKRGIKIGAPEKGVKKTEQIREAIERGLSVSDDMLRDSEVFDDGERLRVSTREDGYGVSGLNNGYRKLSDLLEAFRDKYPSYVATLVDNSGKKIDPYIDDLELANRWPDGINIQVEPWRKYLSGHYKGAAQSAYVARKTRNALEAVKHWADKMNLGDKVTVLTSTDGLNGKKARAKGWFDTKDGKITVVLPNHSDVSDVIRTLLHEGVAHYGLRQLFGEHFDTFLDNVYKAADMDVRQRITDLALRKYKGDFHVATEEYLASLAERTDFERMPDGFWSKIKALFLKMLHSIGFDGFAGMGVTLSDNELRYILWRSYENLKEPGRYRSILGEAEDVARQYELKVGNYGETDATAQQRPTEPEQEAAEGYGVAEKDYKPSGKGYFGNIYTQFKGKVMEGIDFLSRVRGGALQGVWHRNGIGDIDLVWGNDGGGLCHILKKHINDKDFKNKAGFANRLNDIINNGKVDFENGDKVVLKKDGYVVTIRKNIRERGKKIADENWVLTAYNKDAPATTTAPADGTHGSTAVAPGASSGAKLGNNSESDVNKGENVSEPSVWGKKDLLSKAEQVTEGISPELLFRDSIEDDDNTARVTYDMMANQKKNIIREAWQDSMINVRNLQKAVLKQRDETLKPYEDAYEEENRMHGKSKTEEEVFTRNYYDPLLDSVNALAKAAKVSVGDVVQYMMAKHGLERNEVFAERDAQAAWDEYQEKQKQRFAEYQNTHPNSNKTIADFMEKEYDDFYQQYREKDYSGLTELTGTDNVQDAEAEAKSIVSAMESKSDTSDLWQKTNAATKWTLKKAKDCGIVSMANYEQVRDMFDYYIPLRGWKDETADDIYDYVGIRNNDDVFSPTVKKAHGRRSEADNPIAYIGSMAVSAIVQGNKNKVKQTFLSFVWNHPTNLVTVSDMWYRNYGTEQDPDWREEFPDIPEDATADKIASILDQFGKDMEALASQGMATKKKGRLKISVPIKKSQALEHHVKVSLNGKEYVMYINGNPRAAQALNGTRARLAAENSHESAAIANVNRWLGQAYTSLSPAFTVSNLLRDYTMATALTFIKDGPDYARRFQGNMALLGGPTRMFWLMHKYKSGNLNMNNETERLFHEFMTEGGETGYTSLKDIERYKVDMQKKWKRMNRSDADPRELWHDFTDGVENVNRCIEDTVRFATYMTSRKGGKTVRDSVTDAKNITLNFNRKGSGELGNSTFRHLYIFVNPAIQGLNTVASAVKHHPVRFSLAAGFIVSMGLMQPLLIGVAASIFGGGDDGDDWNPSDEYWNLPAWQRRNNFVFWIPGTHKFGMIPLGQEFRMLHGFGETLYSYTHDHADDNPALELASQAADLLPLDMTGNSGNPMVTLMPSLLQPIAQVAANMEFTGRPIYKDSERNKYEPAWQKAYVGTPSFLVSASKGINEITGGNDHRQGWLETFTAKDIHWLKWANNPAIVDHLMKGYLGGPYSFVTGLGGIAWKAMSKGVAPDAQEIPVVNRIVTAPREKEQSGKQKLPDWYYDLSEENARHQNEFSGYKKDYMTGDADGKKKFNALIKSKDFAKWQEVNTYIGAVRQIRTAMSYTKDPAENAELQKNLDEVLAELKKLKDK